MASATIRHLRRIGREQLPSDYKPVAIVVNDEVRILTNSFNSMIAKLADFQTGLEEKVQERTKALGARNRDMRRVFENVDQGFITLDREGVMAMERSAVVDMWFGSYAERKSFATYMGDTDESFSENFAMGWEALTDDFLPVELCLEQLPSKLEVGNQIFALRYTALKNDATAETDDDSWEGVLVVIADITERVTFERVQAAQQELGNAIKAIMKDKQGYGLFHGETGRLLQLVVSGAQDHDIPLLKRSIHTIKGNSAIYGLQTIAQHCHAIEDEMEETNALPSDALRAELADKWGRLDESIQFILNNDEEDEITVSSDTYQKLLGKLHSIGADVQLFQEVFSWQLEPLGGVLSRQAECIQSMANRLGLSDIEIVTEGRGLMVDREFWAPFMGELVHVFRNALDHGLRGLEGRKPALSLAGKTGAGHKPALSLGGETVDQEFILEVTDNGVGIDWKKVAAKAKASGLVTDSHDDLVAALFQDGLSTSEQVTETSGRGVGMAAVKVKVESMGGRIAVESNLGQGTTFRFIFPERLLFGELYESTCEALADDNAGQVAQRAQGARRTRAQKNVVDSPT